MNQKKYLVQGRLWLWGGGEKGSWHFLTIDPDTSRRIRVRYREFARGWGSLPVSVEFAREARATPAPLSTKSKSTKSKSTKSLESRKRSLPVDKDKMNKGVVHLKTSIFPNNKNNNSFVYILPVKKQIRKELGAQDGDILKFTLEVKGEFKRESKESKNDV